MGRFQNCIFQQNIQPILTSSENRSAAICSRSCSGSFSSSPSLSSSWIRLKRLNFYMNKEKFIFRLTYNKYIFFHFSFLHSDDKKIWQQEYFELQKSQFNLRNSQAIGQTYFSPTSMVNKICNIWSTWFYSKLINWFQATIYILIWWWMPSKIENI